MNKEKTPKIIALCGFMGSGKDTVADYLANIHHFRKESFANTLKDAVSIVFGWDRVLLEGSTQESREWREEVDSWWATRLEIPNLTPRWVLQHWGTEVLRQGFHDEIWIASLENKLRKTKDNIVISDCRFVNEMDAMRKYGGIIVRVKRGPEPDWIKNAISYNRHQNESDKKVLECYGVHASEYSWVHADFDYIIDNSKEGLDNLYKQINQIVY